MNFPEFNDSNVRKVVEALNKIPELQKTKEIERINFFLDNEGVSCPYLKSCLKLFYFENPEYRQVMKTHDRS